MDPTREHPLIRRLESITDLSRDEKVALLHLPMTVREVEADQDIVREGDKPSECCLILKGMASRYKIADNGKRQVMSFHIAGELPDAQSLYLKKMDHSVSTVSRCTLGFISHQTFYSLFERHPRLMSVFWRETLIDASIHREWTLNVSRREGAARLAHLLCEMYLRHKAVGLVRGYSFEFQITQSELGDALGFSTVHVNRVLQELREGGLLTFNGKLLTILNWKGMTELAGFDPNYLHQEDADEAA